MRKARRRRMEGMNEMGDNAAIGEYTHALD